MKQDFLLIDQKYELFDLKILNLIIEDKIGLSLIFTFIS